MNLSCLPTKDINFKSVKNTKKDTKMTNALPAVGLVSMVYFVKGGSKKSSYSSSKSGSSDGVVGKTLMWSDEFDKDGSVDSSKWSFEILHVNNEVQQYTTSQSNAYVANGSLVLKAIAQSDGTITSARLVSRGKFEFTYGTLVVRARCPGGVPNGGWPAIWCLGSKGEWPSGMEIDMMEYAPGGWGNNSAATVHWGSNYTDHHQYGTTKYCDISQWNIWKLDWSASQMTISLNNEVMLTYKNNNAYSFPAQTGQNGAKQYIILNYAVGGTMGGNAIDTSKFPATMEIDYVRYYQ
ncbi:glycoside hydrolase family 16 protein [Gonapodya prolifera JEL478]|uniref:Glycoside hydrolase family 16 protein n=1 Tax=Gonapodya prolifera (strain JEL478) TaxID=1344416 RepID=A0A138ZWR9_GONPJ|nr:glycoside hydrolase family 16 protein [Gonapodya prolifera JEL478]|eukprot:KXS08950.1 glycoside hydrolase family 16 protein [Gonapodya prolifera JEL478]